MADGQIRLGPAADGPLIVLLIGCPDDFVDILEIIDGYVASGSQVHLLSTKPMRWREQCLYLHFSRAGKSEFERSCEMFQVPKPEGPEVIRSY
eukprot:g6551.t1